MEKEKYLVNLLGGLSADDVFSGIYSIALVVTIGTSTLAFRGKKRLTPDQVAALDAGNQVMAIVTAIITALYALFHIYAALAWKVSMIAVRRLPHGVVLLASTLGLFYTLVKQVVTRMGNGDEDDNNEPSFIEWIGAYWRRVWGIVKSTSENMDP